MCKVLMVAGIKPENLMKVHKLTQAAAKHMSVVEDDGVGYAAITKSGKIYGEKWRNKDDAFKLNSQPPPDLIAELMNNMLGSMADWVIPPVTNKVYDSFGQRTPEAVKNTVALILHARKASPNSAKTIENVHPFAILDQENQPDTALIHNGLISNHEKLTKTMSTCDSEVILHEYLSNMIYHNPWGIEQVAKTLIGEYAVGVLSSMTDSDETQIPVLDIFKSNKDLYVGYVTELETLVFCTTEYTLKNACEESGLTLKHIVKIKDGYFGRFNAITGQRMEDIISFQTSAKFENVHSRNHEHSMVRASNPGSRLPLTSVGPIIETEITASDATTGSQIDFAKKQFARRHPDLFTTPYIEVKTPLMEHEKALFAELNNNKNTNHKALHLVSVALASATGRA